MFKVWAYDRESRGITLNFYDEIETIQRHFFCFEIEEVPSRNVPAGQHGYFFSLDSILQSAMSDESKEISRLNKKIRYLIDVIVEIKRLVFALFNTTYGLKSKYEELNDFVLEELRKEGVGEVK